MGALTGQRWMKADAFLEYFQSLMEWFEKTNEENGEVIGWPFLFCLYVLKKLEV